MSGRSTSPRTIASEITPSKAEQIRNSDRRAQRLKNYVEGLLPPHLETKVDVVVSPVVETAAVLPATADALLDADETDLPPEQARRLVKQVDGEYLILVTSRPAPTDIIPGDDQITADKAHQFGLVFHETLHILKTAISSVTDLLTAEVDDEYQDLVHDLINTLEDGAIESEAIEGSNFSDNAGVRLAFTRRIHSLFPKDLEDDPEEFSFWDAVSAALYEKAIYPTGIKDALVDPDDSRAAFKTDADRAAFLVVVDELEQLAEDVLAIRSADREDVTHRHDKEASVKRAKRVLKTWEQVLKPILEEGSHDRQSSPPQPPVPQSGPDNDEQGGADQPDSCPQSSSESDSSGPPDQAGDGSEAGQSGQPEAEPSDPDDVDQDGAGDHPEPGQDQDGDGHGDAEADASAQTADQPDEMTVEPVTDPEAADGAVDPADLDIDPADLTTDREAMDDPFQGVLNHPSVDDDNAPDPDDVDLDVSDTPRSSDDHTDSSPDPDSGDASGEKSSRDGDENRGDGDAGRDGTDDTRDDGANGDNGDETGKESGTSPTGAGGQAQESGGGNDDSAADHSQSGDDSGVDDDPQSGDEAGSGGDAGSGDDLAADADGAERDSGGEDVSEGGQDSTAQDGAGEDTDEATDPTSKARELASHTSDFGSESGGDPGSDSDAELDPDADSESGSASDSASEPESGSGSSSDSAPASSLSDDSGQFTIDDFAGGTSGTVGNDLGDHNHEQEQTDEAASGAESSPGSTRDDRPGEDSQGSGEGPSAESETSSEPMSGGDEQQHGEATFDSTGSAGDPPAEATDGNTAGASSVSDSDGSSGQADEGASSEPGDDKATPDIESRGDTPEPGDDGATSKTADRRDRSELGDGEDATEVVDNGDEPEDGDSRDRGSGREDSAGDGADEVGARVADDPSGEPVEPSRPEPRPTPGPAHAGEDSEQEPAIDLDSLEPEPERERRAAEESMVDERELAEELEGLANELEEYRDEASGPDSSGEQSGGGNGAGPGSLDDLTVLPQTDNLVSPGEWEEIEQDAEVVGDTLAKELRLDKQTGSQTGLTSGSFDTGKGHRLSYGDPRVFERDMPGDEKQYALVIILDRSGSMNRGSPPKIQTATAAVVRFALAAEDLGIDVAIIDFYDNEVRLAKPFSVDVEHAQETLLSEEAARGTPLSDALALARNLIQSRSNEPLLVTITDDIPDSVDAVADEIKATYAPICSLTIATDCQRGNPPQKAKQLERKYDRTTTVFDADRLDDRLDQFASLLGGY